MRQLNLGASRALFLMNQGLARLKILHHVVIHRTHFFGVMPLHSYLIYLSFALGQQQSLPKCVDSILHVFAKRCLTGLILLSCLLCYCVTLNIDDLTLLFEDDGKLRLKQPSFQQQKVPFAPYQYCELLYWR